MSATFQDINGQTLEYDKWYPLSPFPYRDFRGFPVLPVEIDIAWRLQRLRSDGGIEWWSPWSITHWSVFTHWRLRLWDWYEI